MNTVTLTIDRFTRALLVVLTVLLAVIACELWIAAPGTMPTASAQIPDTGLQRAQIVDEARRTNQLLEQIRDQLESGTMKVRIEAADKASGKKEAKRP